MRNVRSIKVLRRESEKKKTQEGTNRAGERRSLCCMKSNSKEPRSARAKTTCVQREFGFTNWGGKRKGAGAKPRGGRAGVPHRPRQAFRSAKPVLVTQKLRCDRPSLRMPAAHAVVAAAVAAGTKSEFHVVEYSLQSDHLHLIVEAEDERALSRWLKGLFVRVARALNRLWKCAGQVFPDRFHSRLLATPRAVRTALVYVLRNARKHGSWWGDGPDEYSSGAEFEGWRSAAVSSAPATGASGMSALSSARVRRTLEQLRK